MGQVRGKLESCAVIWGEGRRIWEREGGGGDQNGSRRPRKRQGDERSSHEAQSCQVQTGLLDRVYRGGKKGGRGGRGEVVGGEKKWCGLSGGLRQRGRGDDSTESRVQSETAGNEGKREPPRGVEYIEKKCTDNGGSEEG